MGQKACIWVVVTYRSLNDPLNNAREQKGCTGKKSSVRCNLCPEDKLVSAIIFFYQTVSNSSELIAISVHLYSVKCDTFYLFIY